jgi:CheY-like chemotaxis protein
VKAFCARIFAPAYGFVPANKIKKFEDKIHRWERASARGFKVPRILVVDDDASVRESIGLALNTVGIETVLAESGERALEASGHVSFDGAIVDLMMPGMNGLETIRELRARAPHLPVVVISGSLMQDGDATDLLRMVAELDGVTSLAKPFKLWELLHTVRASFSDPAPSPAAKLAG